MKLKTLIMAAVVACGSLTASAQSAGSFRVGVTGGMNVAKITNQNTDCRIGFNVGVRGEYNLTNNLYLGAGLLFSQKGAHLSETISNAEVSLKENPGYIEIPLVFGGRYGFGNGVYIFGETGPYFSFGVCGKNKTTGTVTGGVSEFLENLGFGTSKDLKTDFFGDNGAQTFDGGWGLRVGVEASGFQVHIGYEYGFSKLYDVEDGGSHNSNWTVGVSYMF